MRQLEDVAAVLWGLFQHTIALSLSGDSASARAAGAEAIRVARERGETWARSEAMWACALDRWVTGDQDTDVAELVREALDLTPNGNQLGMVLDIELLAWIAGSRSRHDEAARLLGAATALWESLGTGIEAFGPALGRHAAHCHAVAKSALGRSRFDALVQQGRARPSDFDAVTDLAQDLPIHVIMDLIGWPQKGRDQLLDMAAGWFDSGGPAGARTSAAEPKVQALMAYLSEVVAKEDLVPGGFGWSVLEAHKRGEIPVEGATGLLAGYVVAAFDTTVSVISSGVWLFARHPEQWEALRAEPALVPAAFNEIVRMESPIQVFSRVTTRDVGLGEGVVIPAGARVMHSYGSANRDERHYTDPDLFDIRRNPLDHLGFGFGNHACAGQGLAKLEAHAVFKALATRVEGIELTGEPVRALNNITRGFSSVPVRVR